MKNEQILLLIGEIRESLAVLNKIHNLYLTYVSAFDDVQKREIRDAVLLTEVLCNSYTCIETILFRISRLFENNLPLDSYLLLDELRRFRHFKRYYFEFDYDWNRLSHLRIVYEKVMILIPDDLESYIEFLTELIDNQHKRDKILL